MLTQILRADAKKVKFDVAGPLCFGGDKVARSVDLSAQLREKDVVVVYDTGSNTVSLWSHHCSRRMPAVWGYSKSNGSVQLMKLKVMTACVNIMSVLCTHFF